MKRAAKTALIPLLCGSILGCATPRSGTRHGDTGKSFPKPHLHLVSSVATGFAPLTALLTAELRDLDPADKRFRDPAERWTRKILDREEISERTPGDENLPPGPARTSFTREVTLTEEGNHRFRLILTGSDGTKVGSNWVTVRVVLRQ